MATIKVRSLLKGNILEWDRVVFGDRGQPFCFQVSKFGTVDAAVVETEIGDIDPAVLKVLIEARVGVVRENNPKWEDVKTDDGGTLAANFAALDSDDTAEDDGVNDSDDRYGWCREGQLYEVV